MYYLTYKSTIFFALVLLHLQAFENTVFISHSSEVVTALSYMFAFSPSKFNCFLRWRFESSQQFRLTAVTHFWQIAFQTCQASVLNHSTVLYGKLLQLFQTVLLLRLFSSSKRFRGFRSGLWDGQFKTMILVFTNQDSHQQSPPQLSWSWKQQSEARLAAGSFKLSFRLPTWMLFIESIVHKNKVLYSSTMHTSDRTEKHDVLRGRNLYFLHHH